MVETRAVRAWFAPSTRQRNRAAREISCTTNHAHREKLGITCFGLHLFFTPVCPGQHPSKSSARMEQFSRPDTRTALSSRKQQSLKHDHHARISFLGITSQQLSSEIILYFFREHVFHVSALPSAMSLPRKTWADWTSLAATTLVVASFYDQCRKRRLR